MEICMGIEERRERRREWDRRYLEKHPDKRKESLINYNNKPKTKERVAAWCSENKDRVNASRTKWYERNKEISHKNAAAYAKANPEWKDAHCAKRRSRELNACPNWLMEEQLNQIETFYHKAKQAFKETGIAHHVDHIIPLQGRKVCGLHVPWNLQILTASENSIKGNRIEDN